MLLATELLLELLKLVEELELLDATELLTELLEELTAAADESGVTTGVLEPPPPPHACKTRTAMTRKKPLTDIKISY
jgi:hypothetical protein